MRLFNHPTIGQLAIHRQWREGLSLSCDNLNYWIAQNEVLWHESYWRSHVDNDQHVQVCETFGGAWCRSRLPYIPDSARSELKFIYETHFWATLLAALSLPNRGTVLELLPGLTFNVPVALQSLHFGGTLHRLDLTPQVKAASYSFLWEWLNEDAFTLVEHALNYDFIISNHIIDDLMMYLHYSEGYCDRPEYFDPAAARKGWRYLSTVDHVHGYSLRLCNWFETLVGHMSANTTLILREFPSTFELRTRDVDRVRYLESVFRQITQRLRGSSISSAFIEIASPIVPVGHRFPNSVFVVRKSP